MWLLGVQPFPQDLITPLEAFQIYYMPLRPSAWLCLFLSMGGKCFVGTLATTVNSLGFPHFFLFFIFLVIKNLSPSKGVAFKERYRNPTDILRIAVIPDHRFLWWTCSLCLFLSECPSESVNLERSDSTVVPLPSPCGRVVGQVALAPSLINQSVWLVQTSLALYMMFVCVCIRLLCISMPTCCGIPVCFSEPDKDIHTLPAWQLLSSHIVTPSRSICGSDLKSLQPTQELLRPIGRQEKNKIESLRVASGPTINGLHPIYQAQHLYVCLSVCVFSCLYQSNQCSSSFSLGPGHGFH